MMIRLMARPAGATLALALCAATAGAVSGLSDANFVDVGDSVSEILDTSGLAFSTMLMGSATAPAFARNASLRTPDALALAPIAGERQTFRKTCPGGGHVTVDAIDVDAGGDLSVGDAFKVTFESCAMEGSIVSGRSEFVVAAHRFEGHDEITELDFRFTALGSPQMRWTGSAHAALRSDLRRGTESYAVSYRDLAVTRGPHAMRWNFSVDVVRPPIGLQVSSVKGAVTVDGLALRLRQDEPFAIGMDGHPRSGQVTASDRQGARLQIEAQRHWYAYRLFAAGNPDEVPDATSQSKPYGAR
jgi:hypothetical protein